MARFIPQNADEQQVPEAKLVIYRYLHRGRPAFMAYKGRQQKIFQNLAFTTTEARDQGVSRLIENETAREDQKRERKHASHGLQENDILYATWGHEQTNVDFYQVVRVPSGRSAVVREIEAETHISDPISMVGTKVPRIGHFVEGSEEINRRTVDVHRLKGLKSWRGDLTKWDGTPRRVSFYG